MTRDPGAGHLAHTAPRAAVDDSGQTTVVLECWWDAALSRGGHDVTTAYVETFWLPVLGPSSTLLLRWCARRLPEHPGGLTVAVADVAAHLGLGRSGSRNGPVLRSLARLCRFGLARELDGGFEVRPHVPPLGDHLVRRLPPDLQRGHRRAAGGSGPDRHPASGSSPGATATERHSRTLTGGARSAARR